MTSRILDYPKVQQVSARTWRLLEGFDYHVGGPNSKVVVHIPEDFVTDFASIPRLFWTILPPFGKYSPGSVIHDWLYKTHYFSRKICDRVFLEAMIVMDVSIWKRQTMYRAVRAFGWWAWRRKKG